MNLTHVCFADDLLMFCHVDKISVSIIKEAIEEFGDISGLLPIYSKSTIIFGSMKVEDQQEILEPKTMGGLGFKELEIWKKCMIIKHLWNIVTDKNTLWVKWVNTVKLKGRSIWAINEEVNDSWGWKNILRLRDKARKSIVMKIGNGDKASVIYDNWCGVGVLQTFITSRDLPMLENSINNIIRRLCLAACVYLIWKEVNCKIFRIERRTVEVLIGGYEVSSRSLSGVVWNSRDCTASVVLFSYSSDAWEEIGSYDMMKKWKSKSFTGRWYHKEGLAIGFTQGLELGSVGIALTSLSIGKSLSW
ncbi:hypothetical protein Tco_0539594 [Tanacetum coccineum]